MINTSGAFLNDLLTPAVRFSPWATPLLGPIAPMVSSDDCRVLTGIPVTRSTTSSPLWPPGDSAPYTLYSHRVSCMKTHTPQGHIKLTEPFNSSERWHNTVTGYLIRHTRLAEKMETIIDWVDAIDCRLVSSEERRVLLSLQRSYFHCWTKPTSGNQSELVFLISDLFLLYVSSWEEKSHHSLEELVHQLDGERHHVHLVTETFGFVKISNKNTNEMIQLKQLHDILHLKVFLDRDPTHRGAHFTEDAQSKLSPWLADALRTKHHLFRKNCV